LNIGLKTTEFFGISQYQKTEEFKGKYKERASIEGENAELEKFHGLNRAGGYGLLSVSKQSKLADKAVNIKNSGNRIFKEEDIRNDILFY